jgi:hypothetical protein
MPRRTIDRDEDLQLDLRLGHMRRQQYTLGTRLPTTTRLAVSFPTPPPDSRQAVVKAWGASPDTTGPHVRYLTHGKGTDGTDTTLFTTQGYVLNTHPFIQDAQHDPHQYRLVVSIPDAGDLSLTRFVQSWMRQVSRDIQEPVDYLAAIHRDTAHTHVHVVLRGRARDGHRVIVPRRYLTHGLRYRAMFLATAWLGPVAARERSAHASLAREVDGAMDVQMREAKKEDGMEDLGKAELGTVYRVIYHDGTRSFFTPREYTHELATHQERISASASFLDARFERHDAGWWMLTGLSSRGQRVDLADSTEREISTLALSPDVARTLGVGTDIIDHGDFTVYYDPETGTPSVQAEYGDRPNLTEASAATLVERRQTLLERVEALLQRQQERARDQGMEL